MCSDIEGREIVRRIWTGFVLGAVTGSAVGLVADLAPTRGRGTSHAAGQRSDGASATESRLALDNVWKGFIVGALTGAGVGLCLDLGQRAQQGLSAAAEELANTTEQAGQAVREEAPKLVRRVADSDSVNAITDAATRTAHDFAHGTRKAGALAADATDDIVQSARDEIKKAKS